MSSSICIIFIFARLFFLLQRPLKELTRLLQKSSSGSSLVTTSFDAFSRSAVIAFSKTDCKEDELLESFLRFLASCIKVGLIAANGVSEFEDSEADATGLLTTGGDNGGGKFAGDAGGVNKSTGVTFD